MQGEHDAQYQLGLLYAQGTCVRQDNAESYKWASLASKTSDPKKRDEALKLRDERAKKLSAKQIAKINAAVKAWQPEQPKE